MPERIIRSWMRTCIKDKDFTIISSDCWGGGVYQDLGLEYKTPTVGLYFFPDCYLNFVEHLDDNLKDNLVFVKSSKYDKANNRRMSKWYPIGQLKHSIEIHFLHYKNESEAERNWNRRKARIIKDRIFLAFSDDEGCQYNHLERFDRLEFPKVVFTSKYFPHIKSSVFLKHLKDKESVGDIYTNRWHVRRHFNLVKWLNNNL